MSNQIREAEWRVLRELMPIALERFCERVLSEVCSFASETDKSARERYLAVFKLIKRRDDELADAFNDVRRLTAMRRLACIKFHDVSTMRNWPASVPKPASSSSFSSRLC